MIDMSDSPPKSAAIIFGTSGGIGRALAMQTVSSAKFDRVYGVSRRTEFGQDTGVSSIIADVTIDADIDIAAQSVTEPIRRLMITTGMLHDNVQTPEKSWRERVEIPLTFLLGP